MLKLDTIYHGDAKELIKKLDSNSIDAVISDIPYGISYDAWDVLHENKNSALLGTSPSQKKAGKVFKSRGKPLNGWSEEDKKIPMEYHEWCKSWTEYLYPAIKPGGSIIIFAGRRLSHRAICAFEDTGFIFKDMIAWNKGKAPHRAQHISKVFERRKDEENATAWEGWKVGNLRPLFEPILWFMKPYKIGGTLADNILEYGVGAYHEEQILLYGQGANNIITFPSDQKVDSGLHPTQKPIRLMEYLVELVTKENQVVLDPFCGSGTTCLAGKNLNRRYIGIERNEEYCQIALYRLKKEPSETKLF